MLTPSVRQLVLRSLSAAALTAAALASTSAMAESKGLGNLLKQASETSTSSAPSTTGGTGLHSGGLGGLGSALGTSGGAGSALGSSASLLDGLGIGKLASGSAGNAAGVLEFCVKNNYLQKANVDTLKKGLLSKAGIAPAEPEKSPSYKEGLEGILKGDTSALDLSKVKGDVTEKACDYVLENATSLL